MTAATLATQKHTPYENEVQIKFLLLVKSALNLKKSNNNNDDDEKQFLFS